MAVLVDLENVSARRSDRILFSNLSATIGDGDRVGVVGINGTGKSTLLRIIAGVDEPEEGIVRRGRGARVGYLEQDPTLSEATVLDAVGNGWEAESVLDRLGLRTVAASPVATLSGGQVKRIALGRVLLGEAELLVLDEPTNHLDLAAITWLEARLAARKGALVLVTHDRHLLERVTTKMLELDRGHLYVHEGGYDAYLEARAEREEKAASAEAVRQNLARRELAWLRRGAKARTRKPQARIDAAVRLIEGRAEPSARADDLDLGFGTPRLGDKVIECSGVGFSYVPGATEVLSNVDLLLAPNERLGLVGANGSGKSTFFELLSGRATPTAGTIEVGPTVVVGYYDQRGSSLDPHARIRDLVAGPTRAPGSPEDVALMERFWFVGELPYARVGTLSGGERRRLQLLLVLAARPNVLLLDEPTNDLDLDTLRILEDLFETWPGALVVASHDRIFLERTTDRLVALEAHHLAAVRGGVDGWLARQAPSARHKIEAAGALASAGRAPAAKAKVDVVAMGERPASGQRAASASTVGYRLREAEKRLARLERRRDELTDALHATREREELAVLGSELAVAQSDLTAAEEGWLALAEEIENRR